MSVIIRLQGLPWSASAMNIRHFFSGLSIPAGGVHIIGGDGGDAFIAFSSDDDARMAMKKNMGALNGTPVQLFLSSKSEMQSVIDAARSGKSFPVAGIAGSMTLPMNNLQQSQSQSQQQRQQFQNLPGAFASVDNQNNAGAAGAMSGQQGNTDFNPPMHNQFAKNEWQGFQMYGRHADSQSPVPNSFQQNQRMQVAQGEGRFSAGQSGSEARGQFGALQQQGKAFLENTAQFPESANTVPQPALGILGMGGMQPKGHADMPPQEPLTQKQNFMNEQIRGRQSSVPESAAVTQSENPIVLPGNIGAMGRGQGNFPSLMGLGPNRDTFNNMTQGRPSLNSDMHAGNIPAGMNLSGPRALLNVGPLNRPIHMGEKAPVEGGESLMPVDALRNQYFGDKNVGPEARVKEMMQWTGDMQPDPHFPGSQKPFDQDTRDEKPNQMGREKLIGLEGRAFEQYPFRGDPERGQRPGMPMDQGPNRMMEREERDSMFAGRDIRMGGRFMADQEQGGRFPPENFPDRPAERFAKDQTAATEDPAHRTRYSPEDEPLGGPTEGRLPGRFPPMRGRPDEARYPLTERDYPPGDHRFPPEDRRMPYRGQGIVAREQERFPEGDRKFPPVGRGFPPGERFPPNERQLAEEEVGHVGDERRFPPGPDGPRYPPEEGRFPRDERMAVPKDHVRSEDYMGRRPGEGSYPPDDIRFREREEELRRRESYGRGVRGPDDRFMSDHMREGRPGIRPGPREFEEDEKGRLQSQDRRFPPERGFRAEPDERDMRGPPGLLDERRVAVSRWERERFDHWQEGEENYPRRAGPRGLMPNPDLPGMRRGEQVGMEAPVDMDQRAGMNVEDVRGPGLEGQRTADDEMMRGLGPEARRLGMRGPGMEGRGGFEGMRGRGLEGMRGRGALEAMRGRGMEGLRLRGMEGRPPLAPGMEGRGPDGEAVEGRPELPSLLDTNTFEHGRRPAARGAPFGEDYAGEQHDFDNRFPGPGGRGLVFDRPPPPRGRGEFFRGRPGPPFARGRGMDMDRRFEEAGPEGRFDMDVDARTGGGHPDAPPLRPLMGEQPSRPPDFSIRPGSGKGLLGDAPMPAKELNPAEMRPDLEKRDIHEDSSRRDVDNRMQRSHDRDRERDRSHRSAERRGRDRDDHRSSDRDRPRYRSERDRSDRRRSRSRDRGSRERGRSRDRSASTKKDESLRMESSREQRTRSIYIKNMPPVVSYKDVRRFLQPIEVPFEGLKLINDEHGQRTGEAFVQFHRSDDATRALRKHGEKVAGHTVQVSLCSDAEYSKAVDSVTARKDGPVGSAPANEKVKLPDDNKLRYIVQLKNLPLNITKQDILQFFKGLTIENNGEAAYIEFDQGGIATGNGFVEFKSDYDYKKALTHDGSLMGTVSIRVCPGKKEEADALRLKQNEMFQRAALRSVTGGRGLPQNIQGQPSRSSVGPTRAQQLTSQPPQTQAVRAATPSAQEGPDTVCVHIQGLPLLATPQDIREFFSDCQIAVRGINIAHDSRGKPLGEGFVEFKSKSDFDKAIKKDKTSLGRHIVAVKPIGKKEMHDRLDNARQRGYPPQQQEIQQIQSGEDQSKSQKPVRDASPAQKLATEQVAQGANTAAQNGQGTKAPPKPLLSGPPVFPSAAPPIGMNVAPGGSKMIPPGVLNKSWFYVRCQNFPPDISIAEIMTFFQGFRPIGESIRLHYSSEGKPTGNAVVGFSTPEEAQSALQRLNMKVCRQNIVTLHPA